MTKTTFSFILPILIIFLFNGCSKDGNLTEFDLSYSESFTIPSTLGLNAPFSAPTPDITTNAESEFSRQNTNADLVKEIKLTSAVLTITSPSNKTFSFLKSVHIFISVKGKPDLDIAYADNVPNVKELKLTTSSSILDSYIKADKFKLSAKVVTDETIVEDIKIKAALSVHVKADIL